MNRARREYWDEGRARFAATPEQLAVYGRTVARIVACLEGVGGCSICGIGEHVEHCPVPHLQRAANDLEFMANIPMADSVGRASWGPVSSDTERKRQYREGQSRECAR